MISEERLADCIRVAGNALAVPDDAKAAILTLVGDQRSTVTAALAPDSSGSAPAVTHVRGRRIRTAPRISPRAVVAMSVAAALVVGMVAGLQWSRQSPRSIVASGALPTSPHLGAKTNSGSVPAPATATSSRDQRIAKTPRDDARAKLFRTSAANVTSTSLAFPKTLHFAAENSSLRAFYNLNNFAADASAYTPLLERALTPSADSHRYTININVLVAVPIDRAAIAQLQAFAQRHRGRFAAPATLRIPTAQLRAARFELEGTGVVMSESVTVHDATLSLNAVTAEIAREMTARGTADVAQRYALTLDDAAAASMSLALIDQHIADLRAQFSALNDDATFATVTIVGNGRH